jgi:hypothetical protein
VWLNAKFAQAGAHGSSQIMQPPLLFEDDRLNTHQGRAWRRIPEQSGASIANN